MSEAGNTVFKAPVVVSKAPDPTRQARSSQIAPEDLGISRNRFLGWWPMMQRYGLLNTRHTRTIGNQGIPGACNAGLRHTALKLNWQILNADNEEDGETEYYTLLLENTRDPWETLIGADGLFDVMAQEMFTAKEGGNVEIVRFEGGRWSGVPIGLYTMDAATLIFQGGREPIAQYAEGKPNVKVAFRQDQVMHSIWNQYMDTKLRWYNRTPIQMAWVAINCLAASDDYNYSLLTEVIPQGILNLGSGFDKAMAKEWKEAWKAARHSGKLEDIGLLWGTDKVNFVRFQEAIKEQPFQHMSYWYLTLVTAAFEMTPLDLGYMTQLNTKAGSETAAEISRNKGLRQLLQSIKRSIEFYILPEGLQFVWEDPDPGDELKEAQSREVNTRAIKDALQAGLLWGDEARMEAVRLGLYEIDPSREPPEGAGMFAEAGEASEEEEDREEAAKSHQPVKVKTTCPLCGHSESFSYEGHGSWLLCGGCGKAYNPDGYAHPV
jgi:hypothetical protein